MFLLLQRNRPEDVGLPPIEQYHREIVLELAVTVGLIYLLLSYPLSLLARWLEMRLRRSPVRPIVVVLVVKSLSL